MQKWTTNVTKYTTNKLHAMIIILLFRWAEITATAFSGCYDDDQNVLHKNWFYSSYLWFNTISHWHSVTSGSYFPSNEHKNDFSVLAILGAAIVYWVLMSNFLYSTVVFVHGETDKIGSWFLASFKHHWCSILHHTHQSISSTHLGKFPKE